MKKQRRTTRLIRDFDLCWHSLMQVVGEQDRGPGTELVFDARVRSAERMDRGNVRCHRAVDAGAQISRLQHANP